MALGKRGRRILQVLGCSILGLVLLCVSVPLWLPWVLRPQAGRLGVRYARYERLGYSHFALDQFSLTNRSTQITARRVEALVPTVWLWRCLVAAQQGPEPFLNARGWTYATVPSGGPEQGVSQTGQEALSLLKSLRRWAPVILLSEGTVRSGGRNISVTELIWAKGELRAQTLTPESVQLRVILTHGAPFTVELRSEPLHLQSNIQIATNAPGLNLSGFGTWWSNRFELRAQFGPEGIWAVSARVEAESFRFPSQLAGLPEYGEISGSATARWEQGTFALDLRAAGQPAPTATNLPPLQLDLHASGDTNAAVIQSALVSSPWLTAELSRGLKIYFEGPFVREPAAFRVKADLSRQPWYPLEGILEGDAELEPTNARLPVVRFGVSGTQIGDSALQARSFTLTGRCDWPWLDVNEIKADFQDGSLLSVGGKMDLQKKIVAEGQLKFHGPLAARWLPAGYSFESAALSATFSGPLEQLKHAGELQVTNGVTPYLAPLQLRAEWSGEALSLSPVQLEVQGTNISLSVAGSTRIGSTNIEAELTSLALSTNRDPALSLVAPFRVTSSRPTGGAGAWAIEASPLRLHGPAGDVQARATLDWPRSGQVELRIQNLTSGLLSEFARQEPFPLEIRNLELLGRWTNAPADFHLKLSAEGWPPDLVHHLQPPEPPSRKIGAAKSTSLTNNPSIPITVEAEVNGDRNGMAISNVLVSTRDSTVMNAHGFMPVTLTPASPMDLLHVESTRPMAFTAEVLPQSLFWKELAARTGFTLGEPELTANVSGTWPKLEGNIELAAREIRLPTARTNLPTLKQLHVSVLLDRNRVRLTRGQVLVQEQPVDLTGELPLASDFWGRLKRKPVPDWQQARLHLLIPRARFAAFQPLFPTLLTPQGELTLDLSLLPGMKVEGTLRVEDGRTRPLANAGPLRNIQVAMRFQDRVVKLEQASANLGGAPVSLTGQADLSGTNWMRGDLPPFVISLRGDNVPLAREPEFILRSDLLLGITKTNGAPPLISGVVRLRDSFYLSDLQALIPGKVASPAERPPYFSLDEAGLAEWRLALDVRGERFLKVRSSLFVDEASATLKVLGTLKDPIALGDVKIDAGVVRFPFGSLQVQQGLIVLTSQDPYHPHLTLTAASKQYGYDIRMEVTGPVDNPVVQFTSTPPLSSEQILLMVTAGQMPQGTFSLTSQQRAQTMALFLGRDLLTKLGVGDQAQQRVTIRSGEEISDQGRPTYHVEYKLTDRWSLEGEYDRFGDFNAGFKWRVYSK